ncbi:hypothetical protein AJ80_07185 [Polytolypa hystricis UAMH7299]|uniref:Translation initiation factor 3 C-terminal domain-containing protein n=1 Tax=Polytolypa hystricis (strain UAMH7299) TaxID=1447883 RepID=A0A2B7XQ29_POLH7|nr:hypothetical protein AJ80_07185 [Polytolypa hystricis UAMH7299]
MKHIRGHITISQALKRTFLPSTDVQRGRFLERHFVPRQPFPPQLRYHSSASSNKTIPARVLIKDEHIQGERVQIVNEQGGLDPPMYLNRALLTFDRSQSFLVQVAPESPERPAVCKLMGRREAREMEKQKSKQIKPDVTKKIELNWGIADHDLNHRLKQMENFLQKGKKVEMVMLRKSRKAIPTAPQAQKLVETVKSRLEEIGAVESKPMDGKLLGLLTLFLEKK